MSLHKVAKFIQEQYYLLVGCSRTRCVVGTDNDNYTLLIVIFM